MTLRLLVAFRVFIIEQNQWFKGPCAKSWLEKKEEVKNDKLKVSKDTICE
jgi:hypothetical protein